MNKQRLKSTISTCSDDVKKKTLNNVYFTIKMTALWTDVERLHVTLFTKKTIKVVLSARIIIIEIWYFFKHRSMLQLHNKGV